MTAINALEQNHRHDMISESGIIVCDRVIYISSFPLFFLQPDFLYTLSAIKCYKNLYLHFFQAFVICAKWIESELNWHIGIARVENCDVFVLHKSFIISRFGICVCMCRLSLPSNEILLKLILFHELLVLSLVFCWHFCDDLVSYELIWRKHFVFFNCIAMFGLYNINTSKTFIHFLLHMPWIFLIGYLFVVSFR